MADDNVVQDLTLRIKTEADKASALKAGQDVGKAVKSGMEEVTRNDLKDFRNAVEKSVGASLKDMYKGVNEAKTKWKDLGETLKDVGKVSVSATKGILGVGGMALKGGFAKISNSIKETTKHLEGFFGAIKRIAIYRAIRWALKEIIQSFKTGIENAYQWSVITGNQFAHSMDMMATSALYLKNSLGAMTMPLVNVLAPILDRIIDEFVDLINVVNQFIATITGASTWVKALKYPAEYLEQAAGSAKELKNQLLGFDELNILNAPRAGGGGSALDYSNMFQQMTLSAKNLDFAKAIKEAIKKGNWKEVGSLISQKFNEIIKNIPAIDWATVIGEKINNAISLIHTLLEETDFQMVGKRITQFLTNLKLDWYNIAGSWARWKTNILDLFIGIIEGVNWTNVGTSISNFLKGVFDHFREWIDGIDWVAKGQDLTYGIYQVINAVDWWGVIKALGKALLSAIAAGIKMAVGSLGGLDWGVILGSGTVNTSYTPSVPSSTASGAVSGALAGLHSNPDPMGLFAGGGYPVRGSMFIAGESGAEWVGNIGGRTGVYNTDQMAMALASANDGVVATLTAVGNAIVGAINRKDVTINTNDVRKALNGMQMRYGV